MPSEIEFTNPVKWWKEYLKKKKQPSPQDLKYIGVSRTGLARKAAESLYNRKKALAKALEE